MARIETIRPLSMADCTAEGARAWGITAEIHSSPDYKRTQDWAEAFARSGFDGICYYLRHDPAQHLIGVALFGPNDPSADLPPAASEPIGIDLLQRVSDRFGILIQPTS